MEERLLVFPCLLVGVLASAISYVLDEHGRLCKKGDPFRHHHAVANRLPSYSRKLSPPFQFFDQSGKGFRGVVRPHHLH